MLLLLPIIPYYLYICIKYSTNLFLECLGFSHSRQIGHSQEKVTKQYMQNPDRHLLPPLPLPQTCWRHWTFSGVSQLLRVAAANCQFRNCSWLTCSTNWKTLFTVCNFYSWKTFSIFIIKKYCDEHSMVDKSHILLAYQKYYQLWHVVGTCTWDGNENAVYGDHVLRTHSVLSLPQLRDRQGILEEGFNC